MTPLESIGQWHDKRRIDAQMSCLNPLIQAANLPEPTESDIAIAKMLAKTIEGYGEGKAS